MTALLGTATVWVVYRAGMRWGAAHGAARRACMLAVMPLHVRESHYVLTDVPMTFLVMLTLLLSLRAHERATACGVRPRRRRGRARPARPKYNGVLAVMMPLIACAMTPAAASVAAGRDCCGSSPAMLAAFLLAAPYTFLDLPTFLNQFARLSSEYHAPAIDARADLADLPQAPAQRAALAGAA